MCSGYWETCNCEDCKEVAGLYKEHEWYSRQKNDNKEIIEEIENKINGMGYSI